MEEEIEKITGLLNSSIVASDINNKSVVQKILDSFPFYILLIDSNHKILLANAAVKKDLELNPLDIVGHYCPKVVHGIDTPFPGCPLEESLKTNRSIEKELYDEKYDKWFTSCIYKTGLFTDENNELFLHVVKDITERKQIEEEFRESEERYRTLFNTSIEGILITEISTQKIKYANPAICQMLGYTEKELIAMDVSAVHPKEALQSVLPALKNQINIRATETLLLRKDGTNFCAELNGVIMIIGGQKYGAGFFSDITERKNKENEIIYLGYHDKLTGLYNRRFVEEEIIRLNTKRQLPFSIIMGDLNNLKLTNDAFGNEQGDMLLKETAKILEEVCRSDDILARWGGDEFIMLLPKTSIANSEEIAQRIKEECANLAIQKIPLMLSIGIATKTEETQDINKVITDAEGNMYKNKLLEKEGNSSSIISALEQTLFEKSNETLEHTLRIKDNAIKLGRLVNLASSQLDELSLLSSLHDIGKVAIPETILQKKGKPTKEEWLVIKRHTEIGFNIAQSSSQIAHIAKLILACHENWDGSGYPQGLKGSEISILSRIIFICDAYDVMTSKRSYKKATGKDDAIKELKRCAGTQFDPELVDKFIKIISE